MSIDHLSDMVQHFQDAAEGQKNAGLEVWVMKSGPDQRSLPLGSRFDLFNDNRKAHKLPYLTMGLPGGGAARLHVRLLAAQGKAVSKYVELSSKAERLVTGQANQASKDSSPEHLASAWIARVFDWSRRRTNGVLSEVKQGWVIDEPFTASIRYLEFLIQQQAIKQEPEKPNRRRSKARMDQQTANKVAWKLLDADPELTVRKLAEMIGCSEGLVSKLPAWKETMSRRRKAKGPAKPKAVNASDNFLKVTASDREPDPLAYLIAEQEKDFEPSPLEKAGRQPIARKSV